MLNFDGLYVQDLYAAMFP